MNFGKFLKEKREGIHVSVRKLSELTGIDHTLLSRFENNKRKPLPRDLEKIKIALELNSDEFLELSKLGEYIKDSETRVNNSGIQKTKVDKEGGDKTVENKNQGVEMNMPANIHALYSDSTFLSVNPYGVMFDFAQTIRTTNKQNVVARIGMSKEHARVLIEKLRGLLDQDKLKQNKISLAKQGN